MKNNNRFANKKDALTASIQSGAANDFALFKSRRQFKRTVSEKKAYKPGNIGPSVIATAIKNAYGSILSRHERKQIAKSTGQPVQKFYSQG
ncbi:hypothetical protein [Paenibacillus brevis]|uniref:Uncharacterized protein n=1 Tax=Paenibacillus brevis TaxID=2841508 RepID=A0ABS6FR54_9BACL|nr:hypothetical protein [Paenibacillus brevis]MBU5672683.1 hypothetical protein [Paenibacillus brevis]